MIVRLNVFELEQSYYATLDLHEYRNKNFSCLSVS